LLEAGLESAALGLLEVQKQVEELQPVELLVEGEEEL
jgi:hypothetical protein